MLRFSSKYGILGCSLHFVILPTSGFTGISDLTKMCSDIWRCVVVPGAIITGQTQRRLCCRLRFQRVTLLCQAPGSRQRKSRRVGTPDLSQRLSSKSMATPETPILRTVLHPSRYQVLLKNGGGQGLGRHWSASTLPRHLRHLAPVHLRNVRAYILFDCTRGIFADNHKKYLHDCILIVTFVCEN